MTIIKVTDQQVKEEIITKLEAHAAELAARVLGGKLTLEETNGAMGLYMFGLVQTYGAMAVALASREFVTRLKENTITTTPTGASQLVN
jgi:hypothetical protein